jgi:hypothetical protein
MREDDERLDRIAKCHEAIAFDLRTLTADLDRMRSKMDDILAFTARLLADAQRNS